VTNGSQGANVPLIPPAPLAYQTGAMIEQNAEVDRAVSALATEILKLSPLEGEARDALCVTIENALSRLALAIMAKQNVHLVGSIPMPPSEQLPPVLSGPI